MALIKKFEKVGMEHPRCHDEVECTYTVFSAANGDKYLQINTFGSKGRQHKGKLSQTIQFDSQSIEQLKQIFASEF